MIASCSDPVQPFSTPAVRLDSARPLIVYPGQEFTVFGSFSRSDPDDYRATIEGFPCTIRAVSQGKMLVVPHPNLLGAGYLTVMMIDDPDRPARLSKRLHIVKSGSPFDTTTVDSIHFDDPILKVTNPGNAYYLQDLTLDVRGFELPVDSFVVSIGPLTISNAVRANSLIKTPNGLTIPAGLLDLPDGSYPVVVSIPTRSRFASGRYVTIGPLQLVGPKVQVYPGDTLSFDQYYPDLYAVANNVRYTEGDPVHGLWRDGSSQRMRVGPLASLAEGLTKIDFVSVKTGRVVAKSTVNSSQQRTEDLQWSPQQQYAGRTIEITYPWISPKFELKSCVIGNAWTDVLSASPTQAKVVLGPNVKQEGIITLTFQDPTDGSQITIKSRDRFVPLLRGTPPVPSVRLRIDFIIPGQWERRLNGSLNTTPGIETFTLVLLNNCSGQWCDTNLTNTYMSYLSAEDKRVDSYTETDSASGAITFLESTGSAQELNANHFHREVQTSHNTTFDRFHNLTLELEDLGVAIKNGNGSHTITLVGDDAYQAIRSVKYAYYNTTRVSGGEGTSWVKLIGLEPSLASQCAITLTFTQ